MKEESPYFQVLIDGFRITCVADGVPYSADLLVQHAKLTDSFGLDEAYGFVCYVGIGPPDRVWPELVVMQVHDPGFEFFPGVLIVPETKIAFIGASARMLAYDLRVPVRLWEEKMSWGFHRWNREGDVCLGCCEQGLAAWTIHGARLWAHWLNPPWDYTIHDGMLTIDDFDGQQQFPLKMGPPAARRAWGLD